MSYLAVDILGVHLFSNKPIRKIGKTFSCWVDPMNKNSITLPKGFDKILYNNNLLGENNVPFYKRNMNWGDNPIYVKETGHCGFDSEDENEQVNNVRNDKSFVTDYTRIAA